MLVSCRNRSSSGRPGASVPLSTAVCLPSDWLRGQRADVGDQRVHAAGAERDGEDRDDLPALQQGRPPVQRGKRLRWRPGWRPGWRGREPARSRCSPGSRRSWSFSIAEPVGANSPLRAEPLVWTQYCGTAPVRHRYLAEVIMYQPYPSAASTVEPERPAAPPTVQNAVKLMYAGAAVSTVSLIVSLVDLGGTKSAIRKARPEPHRGPGQPAEHVHHHAGDRRRGGRGRAVAVDGAGQRPGPELGPDLVDRVVRPGDPGPVRRARESRKHCSAWCSRC